MKTSQKKETVLVPALHSVRTTNKEDGTRGSYCLVARTEFQEDFKAVGVSFTVGSDSLYGEAVQKDAEDICNMQAGGDQRGKLCWFDLRLSEKAFKTKEGKDVTRTEVRVRKILPCW